MADQSDFDMLSELFKEFNTSIALNISEDGEFDLEALWRSVESQEAGNEPEVASGVAHDFPLVYRIVATILHSTIFIIGVTGNLILIAAARRCRSLHTPTYTYLVSVACADLLVLCTAVPEAIVNHHVGKRWLFGSAGCAVFVFLNFLGINVGSLSIMAFTFERYIAVCRPLLAYRLCTVKRTKKIIYAGWILVLVYCCPWLALTEMKTESNNRQQCKFRMSKDQYSIFFIADLVIFYLIPLLTALLCYINIAVVVGQRQKSVQSSVRNYDQEALDVPLRQRHASSAVSLYQRRPSAKSGGSVNRMLVVVVILFAVSWFPFRFLLVYNSFVTRSWLDIWFLLFAKTLIYLNSAINPLLYNIMSQRFRRAVRKTLTGIWHTGQLHRSDTIQSRNHSDPGNTGVIASHQIIQKPRSYGFCCKADPIDAV